MIKGRCEYYCNHCGFTAEDYIEFVAKKQISNSPYYTAWRANFKQTMNSERIVNGRVLLNERVRIPVRCL
jgi:hypothetical protein